MKFISCSIGEEIDAELVRQEELRDAGKFRYLPEELAPHEGAIVLAEEHGEVMKEACELLNLNGNGQNAPILRRMRTELIQSIAVALGVIASIDDELE